MTLVPGRNAVRMEGFPEELTFSLGSEGRVGVNRVHKERGRGFQEWPIQQT